jgi:hypothetical protein
MRIYLMSSTGYYVKSVHNNGVAFTNQQNLAHCFNDMSVGEFQQLKEHVENSLKCELEIDFA